MIWKSNGINIIDQTHPEFDNDIDFEPVAHVLVNKNNSVGQA